ncbi:MAG: hypothetical protein ACRD0W_05665 [Acidimicrobiales bacterium]
MTINLELVLIFLAVVLLALAAVSWPRKTGRFNLIAGAACLLVIALVLTPRV